MVIKRNVILLVIFIIICNFTVFADKIGYIDSEKIKSKLKEYSEALEQFNKEKAEWDAKAQKMKKEIEDMIQELEKQKLLLSPDKIKERDRLIQTKKLEYQKYLNEVWGDQGLAFKREKELTAPIVDKIHKTIKEIADKQGYDVVFDIVESNIIFIKKDNDLTEEVIKKLSEKLE